jgi:hypothetical protein
MKRRKNKKRETRQETGEPKEKKINNREMWSDVGIPSKYRTYLFN